MNPIESFWLFLVFEAAELGLPVSAEMHPEFMRFMNPFPRPMRRAPTVEYLPGPRRPLEGGSSPSPG